MRLAGELEQGGGRIGKDRLQGEGYRNGSGMATGTGVKDKGWLLVLAVVAGGGCGWLSGSTAGWRGGGGGGQRVVVGQVG